MFNTPVFDRLYAEFAFTVNDRFLAELKDGVRDVCRVSGAHIDECGHCTWNRYN